MFITFEFNNKQLNKNIMNTSKLLFTTILLSSLIIGCSKIRDTAKDIAMAQDNALTQQLGNDVQAIVDQSIETNIVGDLKTGEASDISGGDIKIDTPNGIITINFATEYQGTRSGHKFLGMVMIKHNGKKYNSEGFEATVSFKGFSINGNKIDDASTVVFRTLGGGTAEMRWDMDANYKLFNTSNEPITAKVKIQKSITKGFTTTLWDDNEYSITGSMEGVSSVGDAYTVSIKEPLIKKNSCVYITKGILVYSKDGSTEDKTLDFGDGSGCDNKATLNAYGIAKEITLQ
jgi:hypothetical protein